MHWWWFRLIPIKNPVEKTPWNTEAQIAAMLKWFPVIWQVKPGFVFMTLMEMIFQKQCVSFLLHRHGGCFLPIIPQKANVVWWNASASVILQTLAVLARWLLNMNQYNDTASLSSTLFSAEQWCKRLFYTENTKNVLAEVKRRVSIVSTSCT